MAANKRGLLIVHTGDGKGKTTAALGCMLRALGHGMKVCLVQFVKGSWKSGELDALARFGDLAEVHVMGLGFTWESKNPELDAAAAMDAWAFARRLLSEGRHSLVVLDEATYLPKHGVITESELLAGLAARVPGTTVVVTGRGAGPALLEAADIATEMRSIRHAFDRGEKARRGIEF